MFSKYIKLNLGDILVRVPSYPPIFFFFQTFSNVTQELLLVMKIPTASTQLEVFRALVRMDLREMDLTALVQILQIPFCTLIKALRNICFFEKCYNLAVVAEYYNN